MTHLDRVALASLVTATVTISTISGAMADQVGGMELSAGATIVFTNEVLVACPMKSLRALFFSKDNAYLGSGCWSIGDKRRIKVAWLDENTRKTIRAITYDGDAWYTLAGPSTKDLAEPHDVSLAANVRGGFYHFTDLPEQCAEAWRATYERDYSGRELRRGCYTVVKEPRSALRVQWVDGTKEDVWMLGVKLTPYGQAQ